MILVVCMNDAIQKSRMVAFVGVPRPMFLRSCDRISIINVHKKKENAMS